MAETISPPEIPAATAEAMKRAVLRNRVGRAIAALDGQLDGVFDDELMSSNVVADGLLDVRNILAPPAPEAPPAVVEQPAQPAYL